MPAGISASPGALPLKFLIVEFGFGKPENEVCFVSLVAVLINIVTNAYAKIFFVMIGQGVILLELGSIKINILACLICLAFLKQYFDHVDEFRDAVSCRLYNIRHTDIQFGEIIKKYLGIIICDLKYGLMLALSTLEHLIFAGIGITGKMSHVGYVHDTLNIISRIDKSLYQHILADVSTKISDVCKMIYGRSAGIHRYLAFLTGFEFFYLSACSVIQLH